MPPARPAPLKTTGPHINIRTTHLSVPFSPLPSEIPRTPIAGTPIFDLKTPLTAEALKTPITPPAAYTDFLKATVNSPALASPRTTLPPYSPAATTFKTGLKTPVTPHDQPARKKPRCPSAPRASSSSSSPADAADRSCVSAPPADVKREHAEKTELPAETEPADAKWSPPEVTVKQIVKTTVTYTPPALMPAPKGKRRRGE